VRPLGLSGRPRSVVLTLGRRRLRCAGRSLRHYDVQVLHLQHLSQQPVLRCERVGGGECALVVCVFGRARPRWRAHGAVWRLAATLLSTSCSRVCCTPATERVWLDVECRRRRCL
jgi:hypothetical protein